MLIEMAFNFPEAWNVARGYLMIWADVVHFLSCHGCPSATSPSRYLKSRWWLEQTQSTYAGELQACARTCSKRIGKRIGKSSITPIEKLNLSCLEMQMPSIQVHKKGWWVGQLFPFPPPGRPSKKKIPSWTPKNLEKNPKFGVGERLEAFYM